MYIVLHRGANQQQLLHENWKASAASVRFGHFCFVLLRRICEGLHGCRVYWDRPSRTAAPLDLFLAEARNSPLIVSSVTSICKGQTYKYNTLFPPASTFGLFQFFCSWVHFSVKMSNLTAADTADWQNQTEVSTWQCVYLNKYVLDGSWILVFFGGSKFGFGEQRPVREVRSLIFVIDSTPAALKLVWISGFLGE